MQERALTIQPILRISSLKGMHTPTPMVLPVVTKAVMDPLMKPRKPAGDISELADQRVLQKYFRARQETYQYPGEADSTRPTPT